MQSGHIHVLFVFVEQDPLRWETRSFRLRELTQYDPTFRKNAVFPLINELLGKQISVHDITIEKQSLFFFAHQFAGDDGLETLAAGA